MYQFSQVNNATLNAIRQRATGRCLAFPDRELPPGTSPNRARVGLEVAEDGTTSVLVDKHIRYDGPVASIRQWLEDGVLRFDRFDQLRRWLHEDISGAFIQETREAAFQMPGLRCDWPNPDSRLPLIAREPIVEQVEATLERRFYRVAPLLIGPTGVGKSAICHEVARRWQVAAPRNLALRVDLPLLFAGAMFPAERTQRLVRAFEGVRELGTCVLLIFEDLHLVCGAAHSSASPHGDPFAALALHEAIDAGVRLLATTTPRGLKRLADTSLRKTLRLIEVKEPNPLVLRREIMPAMADKLFTMTGVEVAKESLALALAKSNEQSGAQPAKVISLLEQAVTIAKRKGLSVLGPDDLLGSV